MIKQLFKLVTISTMAFYIFSCSAGSGGPVVTEAPKKEIPDARTIPSVKSLNVESDRFMCGSSFSSELSDNQMVIKTLLNEDKTFSFVFKFYDSPCIATDSASGNVIATFKVSGNYSVTDQAGHVILTITDSTMTILAGDYPVATKKFVDWMNSCSNMEGSFSPTQNTTLSLPLGPKCDANVKRAFAFVRNGDSQESTEEELNRLVTDNSK